MRSSPGSRRRRRCCSAPTAAPEIHNNLTRAEARERAGLISVDHYDVRLDFTGDDLTFGVETTVTFTSTAPGESTFIEFEGSLKSALLNGHALPDPDGGRLRLDRLEAENSLTIEGTGSYSKDGSGISRFSDPVDARTYLHSMFGEHSAHRAYPCFDQPDLKATFAFTVKAPENWVVVSNTPGAQGANGVWTFPKTRAMSTYITAVVAGEYRSVHQDHRGIPLGLYCRQSLAEYFDPDEIFEITRTGLDFFERRFGLRYPFGKYDQIYVPEFSSGAMENIACVVHNERMIFRSKVTEADRMHRAETTLHEMAHMWFGDLVSPRWWDDMWLNESFAEYMGFLGVAEATRFGGAWTEFAVATKAAARAQDQLPTTHPIVADIPDVEALSLNLDAITYNKGASALQQLVVWVGADAFFRGIEAYLTGHAYGNAELADFLEALEKSSGRDLHAWAREWLETAGVNTMGVELDLDDGLIRAATLKQSAPPEHPTLRHHRLRVGLFDLDGGRLKLRRSVELDIEGNTTIISELIGEPAPDLVLPNDGDLTYCKIRLDDRSLETLTRHLREIDDPLARALAWGALWDMTRDAELRARDYVDISLDNIDVETDASTLVSLLGRTEVAAERFCDPGHRAAARARLAAASRMHLESSPPGGDMQLIWAMVFIRAARDPDDLAWVHGLLDGTATAQGLAVDFQVRWAAVNALATIGLTDDEFIARELDRDPSDQGQRQAAAARAARPLAAAKEDAWRMVVDGAAPSFAIKGAISGGFHRVDQQELLGAFVHPFFESLLPVWEANTAEQAIWIARLMYPRAVITQEVVDATDQAVSQELPGPLRRTLLESQDGIKRALMAQAFDSEAARSPRGA
ncbi:MAG TPA: aminopeptidase N [Candidatus Acidoferrum sp.]|nr:aminopeptidase N [Candidatus Acidoferrum sp.]